MGILKLISGVVLLANTALGIDIPQVPTWPSDRCTDKSLTIPSWIISRYKVSGGTTTFRITNRAAVDTGLIADIKCTSNGKCQSSGIDEIHGTISQDGSGNPVIGLSEIWVCGDAGDKVVFNAKGNTTITQCSGSDCTSPITYLVYGSLSLPIPLTPVQPSPPAGYNSPTCASVGENQWTVSDVSFKNYTKGQCKDWYQQDEFCIDPVNDLFIRKGLYLDFNVTNSAISHSVQCSFTPSYNDYIPPSPLRCTGGMYNEITLDVTWSGTASNFNLKVEELWYCLENPTTNVNPTLVVASGSTPLSLSCTTSTGITGIADDIITICTDPISSHSISGVQTAKQTLPPFSLITAYPAQGGCTFDSVVNPTWYYRGMFFETNPFPADSPGSTTLNKFTAGLTGPGFKDYFFYQNKAISGKGVDTVYNCNAYNNGKPEAEHWNCTYAFNPHTKMITQDKVWECSDKNPAAPLYFDGSGIFDWTVDPNFYCTSPGGNTTRCLWTDSLAQLQPGVPYDVPKITVSLVNVLPTHYEQTMRINGEWKKVDSEKLGSARGT